MADGGLRYRSREGRGVLAATVLGSSVAFLDTTVVNVALPTIEESLGASFAGLQWTVDAYLLALSALLLIGGALGDRYGRRRMFAVGLAWFAVASALCAFAPSTAVLAGARALQGAGAAMLVPGSLALLRACFDGSDRDAAIGAWAGLSGVATAFGPLLGGWMIEAWSWRAVFLINVPITALAIWATLKRVPESRSAERGRLDVAGAATAAIGLGALTFGLIEAPRAGGSALATAMLVLGGVTLVAFVALERVRREPMLPPAIFRSRQFSGANATTLGVYFALGGTTFLLVIYLQQVLGYSAIAAGAALTPITLLLLALSPVAGRVASVVGHRAPMSIGPVVSAGGLLLLARIDADTGYFAGVLPGVVVLGLGLATTVAPLTAAVLEGAETRFAGLASGVNNAVARTASLLAVALLPLLSGMVTGGSSNPESLAAGFPHALRICAALCAAGGFVAFLTVERRGPVAASRQRPPAPR